MTWFRKGSGSHGYCFRMDRYFHTLVLAAGTVWSFGRNEDGELGRSGRTDAGRVDALETMTITAVAAGDSFSVVVTDQGQVLGMGRNHRGQLGLGAELGEQSTRLPRLVKSLRSTSIVHVTAGGRHVLALSLAGEVFSWGEVCLAKCGRQRGICKLLKAYLNFSMLQHALVTSLLCATTFFL